MELGDLILLEDLGMRYPTETSKQKVRYGLYKCFCGNEFETVISNVKRGQKSCGCIKGVPHNLSTHRLYDIWRQMIKRCHDSCNSRYKYYGARGITVCEEWHDVRKFVEDMYPSFEEGLSLDREDNDLGYSKDNCRWVNKTIQSRNTRKLRVDNTSGYRGVCFSNKNNKWAANIQVNNKPKHLGYFNTALEAAKAYETFVRINELEHNFTPVLSDEEIDKLNLKKKI